MRNNSTYIPQYSHEDVEILAQESIYKGFMRVEKLKLRHRLFETQEIGRAHV